MTTVSLTPATGAAHVNTQEARDPELFAGSVRAAAARLGAAGRGPLTLALGQEPGTSAGDCYADYDPGRPSDPSSASVAVGRSDLPAGRFDAGARRFAQLCQFLTALGPDLVASEEPGFTPGEAAEKGNVAAPPGRAPTAAESLAREPSGGDGVGDGDVR
jgi:hypothetical protein